MDEAEKTDLYTLIAEARLQPETWSKVQIFLRAAANLDTPVDAVYGNVVGKLIREKAPLSIVRLALELGASPNIPNGRYDKTPLFYISTPEELHLLHEFGADLDFVNEYGASYLYDMVHQPLPLFRHHLELGGNFRHGGRLLYEFTQHSPESLVKNERLEVIRLMAQHGLDIHAFSSEGINPLHFAVIALNPAMVELLLALGADTNVTTSLPFEFLDEFVFPAGSAAKDLLAIIDSYRDRYDPALMNDYEATRILVEGASA